MVWHLPAAAAHAVRPHPRTHARGRGRRVRLRVADGPSGCAARARGRHVGGLDGRDRARGADLDDPLRPSRAVRSLPPSGAARQDGRDARRDLGGPARAWESDGDRCPTSCVRTDSDPSHLRSARRSCARRSRSSTSCSRARPSTTTGTHFTARARDGPAGSRAVARAGAHRRRRAQAHDAARGAIRRLVELPRLRARPHRRAPAARGRRAHLDPAPDRARARCRGA